MLFLHSPRVWVPGCPRTDNPGYIIWLFPPTSPGPNFSNRNSTPPQGSSCILLLSRPLTTSSWPPAPLPPLDHSVTQQGKALSAGEAVSGEEDVVLVGAGGEGN